MRIKPIIAVALSLIIAATTIVATQQLGIWEQGKGKKAPTLLSDGTYHVDDIKGSFTLDEVGNYYGIPLETIAEAFGLDAAYAENLACKDLAAEYPKAQHAINATTVKLFVACYKGTEFDLADGKAYLPESAVVVLEREGTPTDAQRVYLADHSFDPTVEDNTNAAGQGDGTGAGAGSGSGSGDGSGKGASGSEKTPAAGSVTDVAISGSTPLIEISTTYGIDAENLMTAFALTPDEYAFFSAKDLKTKFADAPSTIGPNSLKLFTALYVGAEYDLANAETYLPATAVEVLQARGNLTEEQKNYLATHTL